MQDKKTWLTVSILKFVPDRPMRVHCTVFNDAFPSPKLSETIKITFKDFVEATVHKFSQHDQLELACEPPGQVGTLSYIGDSVLCALRTDDNIFKNTYWESHRFRCFISCSTFFVQTIIIGWSPTN